MHEAVSHAITHARGARGSDDICNDWLTDVASGVDNVPTNSLHDGDSRLERRPKLPDPAETCYDSNIDGPSIAAHDHRADEDPSHPQVVPPLTAESELPLTRPLS